MWHNNNVILLHPRVPRVDLDFRATDHLCQRKCFLHSTADASIINKLHKFIGNVKCSNIHVILVNYVSRSSILFAGILCPGLKNVRITADFSTGPIRELQSKPEKEKREAILKMCLVNQKCRFYSLLKCWRKPESSRGISQELPCNNYGEGMSMLGMQLSSQLVFVCGWYEMEWNALLHCYKL